MKLNLPNPGLHWVKESPIDWSLMTKGENPVEMARISKEDNEWEWITFFFSMSPDGADEIESGWTSSVKEAKAKVKESLLKAGAIKK
jgi:hypothetical protein